MHLFLREAVELDGQYRKHSIGAIRLAVWGDADDVKKALRD